MDHQDPADLHNVTFNEEEITPEESTKYIAHEIVFTLFAIVGICADTAIIYTIFRFRRIRTVPNIFLANWAITDICSLFFTPSAYRIISVIDHISYSAEFVCSLFEIGSIFHITEMLFVILVMIDWFINAYFRRASEKFRKFYKFVLGTIWITILLACAVTTGLCLNEIYFYYYYYTESILICTYGAILLSVIALQSVRGVQKCRKRPLESSTQMLTLVSAFALSYLLAFLNIIIINHTTYHPLFAILSACAIFSSSIVNFIILYLFNKDFQACFFQAIKCNKDSYDESILDFDPTNNTENDNCNIQVTFHNQTEQLLTNY